MRGLLWSSIYDDNPVVFFEHRTLYGIKEEVPDELEPIELGKARVHREGDGRDRGRDRAGSCTRRSPRRSEAEDEGISVEVVDPRTLQPLDEEALVASVKKTNRCVVAHEAVTRMGFGAEIAAVVQYQAFDWLDAPIERVGAKFTPLPFAPVMEEFVVPHADDVLAAISRTVGGPWRLRSSSRGSARAWRRARSSAGSSPRASRSRRASRSTSSTPTR